MLSVYKKSLTEYEYLVTMFLAFRFSSLGGMFLRRFLS